VALVVFFIFIRDKRTLVLSLGWVTFIGVIIQTGSILVVNGNRMKIIISDIQHGERKKQITSQTYLILLLLISYFLVVLKSNVKR
jgi:hypothetical protein